jgi:trehalose 6-phosphate phosphatase
VPPRQRDLLLPSHLPRLRRFAAGRVLLAFDFDGTLAPIVDDRADARARPATLALLAELVRRYPVAVISGRTVADVRERLGGVAVAAIVGNHGIEPSAAMPDAARDVAAWTPLLRAALAAEPGVVVEDKRFSLAVHYRGATDRARSRAAIHAAAALLPSSPRVADGHSVVSLVPAYAPTKGDALRALQGSLGADATLFVGDDVTDEDAFAAQDGVESLGVRVGRLAGSAAPYFIRSQSEIELLLERLIASRPAPAASAVTP